MKEFKLFEVAKEFDMPHKSFIELLNGIGFPDLKGFSTNLNSEEAEEIRSAVKSHFIKIDLNEKEALEVVKKADKLEKLVSREKKEEFKGLNVAKMIGTYYNQETRRYHLIELNLTPEQLAELEVDPGESFGTIYNLNHDFNVSIGKRGILKSSKLEDKKWRDYE